MRIRGKNLKITVNDLTVSYHDEGPVDAPAIIFIHGFPLNKSMWDGQLGALKDNYRVIAYDIRGHGNTGSSEENFSIDLFTNDLIFLMDALDLKKPALCGLSMGGYIALNAIGKFPEHFSALVLSDTQCTADSAEAKVKRIQTIENIHRSGVENYAEESLKKLFATVSFTTKQQEIAAVRKMIVQTTPQSLSYTLFALAERKGTCNKLQDIEVPVLIIVGEFDEITPLAAARLMHGKIQGAQLNILANSGHLANLENALEFNGLLKQFIPQVSKKLIPLVLAENLLSIGI